MNDCTGLYLPFSEIFLTNNDILRRLRYTFNFNNDKVKSLFIAGDLQVSNTDIHHWLKKDDDADFISCPDHCFAAFLNGLINVRRGKKEGVAPVLEQRLNNNIILTKLKIAFNLTSDDIIALLANVDFRASKGELSAFFRKPDHKNYRVCKDQLLRNFLQGINKKFYVERREHKASTNTGIKNNSTQKKFTQNKSNISNQDNTATPNASKLYVNPNASKTEKKPQQRKVLKLKSKDIWGE